MEFRHTPFSNPNFAILSFLPYNYFHHLPTTSTRSCTIGCSQSEGTISPASLSRTSLMLPTITLPWHPLRRWRHPRLRSMSSPRQAVLARDSDFRLDCQRQWALQPAFCACQDHLSRLVLRPTKSKDTNTADMYLASRFALSLAAMQQAAAQSYNIEDKVQKSKTSMTPHRLSKKGCSVTSSDQSNQVTKETKRHTRYLTLQWLRNFEQLYISTD